MLVKFAPGRQMEYSVAQISASPARQMEIGTALSRQSLKKRQNSASSLPRGLVLHFRMAHASSETNYPYEQRRTGPDYRFRGSLEAFLSHPDPKNSSLPAKMLTEYSKIIVSIGKNSGHRTIGLWCAKS